MALVKETLKTGLIALVSNPDVFPNSYELSAQNFGSAINSYGSLVTPPSTTSAVALSAFIATYIGSRPKKNIEILTDAVKTYCAALATGMAPVFIATPPTVVAEQAMKVAINAASKIALKGGSASNWAIATANAIDAYFRTGIAVNSTSGVTVTWV